MEILDLYKQSQIHKVISKDVELKMLNHCYLLASSDEYKINNFVFAVAKEIYCLGDNSPCNECNNCMKIEHSNMVDLCVYPKTDKSLVVDDVNEIVTDCYITPVENTYKVYILKNFDDCTVQAQNKLLKTLEEPPKNVIFLLTCVNENMVLQTIRSRSKVIREPLLDIGVLAEYLAEQKVPNSTLVSQISDGNIATALKLSDSVDTSGVVDLCIDMLKNMKASSDILRYSSRILAYKKDIPFVLDTLIIILKDVAVSPSKEFMNFASRCDEIMAISSDYSRSAIFRIVDKICEVFNKIEFNCNIVGLVDKLLLDILEVKFLCH